MGNAGKPEGEKDMRIGIYDPYLDTLAGGEKYMLTIASCLSKNHEVSVFWDKEKETIKKRIEEKFGMQFSNVSFVSNIFASHVSFLQRFLESKKYDAVIVLSDGSIPLVGTKLILHFQSPMEWIQPSLKTKLKLRRTTKIICNSEFTKSYIDKEFGVSSDVIYPPVITSLEKNHKKENIILNVGRYGIAQAGSSYKKQEVLVEAFKKLYKDGIKDWKLVFIVSLFAEDTHILDNFKEMIQGYPIEVIVNPSNKKLWELYSKTKIYWHASGFGEDLEKHPDRAEHFGMSTVESMGNGAVAIVINAGGQKEIVTDGKNGYLWDSEEELLDKTKKVIKEEKLYKEIAENAKKRAEDFSIEHFCTLWNESIK